MPRKRGLPRGLPVATKAQKAADKGVKIRRVVVGSNRFTPDEALSRPANYKCGHIVRTAVPVQREKIATEKARTLREKPVVYLPSTGLLEETKIKVNGVKRTQLRAVRTVDMGDEPLPVLARRYL